MLSLLVVSNPMVPSHVKFAYVRTIRAQAQDQDFLVERIFRSSSGRRCKRRSLTLICSASTHDIFLFLFIVVSVVVGVL